MMTTRLPSGDVLNHELLHASEHGSTELAANLVEQGADVNTAGTNGWTPLMLAILKDSPALAKMLLASGADPNRTTTSEENPCRSPLVVAIRNGRVSMVQLLIEHGVSKNGGTENGLSPRDLARKLTLRPFHQEEIAQIVTLLDAD